MSEEEKTLNYIPVFNKGKSNELPTENTDIVNKAYCDANAGEINLFEVVANEDLKKYQVSTTDGYKANSNSSSHRFKIYGVVFADIDNGFTGNVVTYGEMENPSWNWNHPSIIFLNGNELSATPPTTGFCIEIAKTISNRKIFIDIEKYGRLLAN